MKRKFIVLNKKTIINIVIVMCFLTSLFFIGVTFVGDTIEVASKNRLLPIYSVETDKKHVALTFDCAWGADDIPSIIKTLSKNNVKATFFTVGDWVVKNPKAVESLDEAGMEIR